MTVGVREQRKVDVPRENSPRWHPEESAARNLFLLLSAAGPPGAREWEEENYSATVNSTVSEASTREPGVGA
jgi:hypothetical protein